MKIKKIEIQGFKSFADKTEIELGDGLTAVVGPNGSGKSNLAEAIKWVLGEQSARVLRGNRMDDVIFSGTAKRKSVGFAEVTLIFDNTSKRLPIEYTEVAITRRAYRSGEGEYYINRKSCRLKDITELFLDTGIGKDSYSFIGQGRIEEILSADPRQRRHVFEEAAGISRYKMRKRETELRLQDTSSNLRRIEDISGELELQLAPLAEEAERARIYLTVQEERRAWEKELLLYEMSLAERQEQSLKTQLERLSDEILSLENRLSITEAEKTAATVEQASFLSAIGDLEHQLMQHRLIRQQKIEKLTETGERLASLRKSRDSMQVLANDQVGEINTIEETLVTARARLEVLSEKKEQLESLLRLQSFPSSDADGSSGEDQDHVKRLEQHIAELEGAVLSGRGNLAQFERQAAQFSEEIGTAEKEVSLVASRLLEKQHEHGEKDHALDEIKAELLKQKEIREVLVGDLASHRLVQTSYGDKLKEGQGALMRAQNRLNTLRIAEQQQEGLSRGARYVLSLALPGVRGALGNLVSTSREYEVAIEVALGGAVSDILTDTEATAKKAISSLRERGMGRATFYPLDALRPRPERPLPQHIDATTGFFGRASDLVTVPEFAKPVISHLLGNVLVVQNLDTATAVARKSGYTLRVVTMDGDVIMPGGSMSGGSRPEKQAVVLSRRREIEELEKEVSSVSKTIAELESSIQEIHVQMSNLSAREVEIQAVCLTFEEEVSRYKHLLAGLNGELDYLVKQQNSLNQQITDKRLRLEKIRQERASCEETVGASQQELAQARQSIKEWQSNDLARQKALQEQAQKRMELEIELAKVNSDYTVANHSCEEKLRRLQELKLRQENYEVTLTEHEQQVLDLSQKVTDLEVEIADADVTASDLTVSLESNRLQRAQVQELEKESFALAEEVRKEINLARQRIHALDVRLARVQTEREHLATRFSESYPVEEAQPSKLANRAEAENQMTLLDERLAEIGNVRVSSISESERLQTRISFLGNEGQDLIEASAKLQAVIQELDVVMSARFMDTFNLVRREFSDIAVGLFKGGAARLTLVSPEAPLDSGIEIDIQPPGKRLQNISLLSGGERSLAAVALLCSVLRVKPTPFCVLDEIDAALDDANVDRLLPLLRELSTLTQFLLITHTKGTMMAADMLYGVTMPEQGVSKVLSVRMSELTSA